MKLRQQFPDKAQYVIIDTVCDNPNVNSYIFKPQEAAYLIGIVAAMVSADAANRKVLSAVYMRIPDRAL
jgi:basic membrane lipoprotein Med (substrate-binding protein (PBP1-ABC) superfamily)